MKFILIVLDGAGDLGRQTPLSLAKKPNIDSLAKEGKCGLLDIGYGKTVNSDFGYLNILGCYSKEGYPGRGYLEALGIGLKPGPGDICIRGNFATLASNGNLLDRRAGRDETGLEYFCEALDGMEIDGVRFTVRKSAGHRVVIVLGGKKLSDKIIPNDPLKIGAPLQQVGAKESQAKFTASVLNKFSSRAHKILSKEPDNKKRRLPANIILIRNIGRKKDVEGFQERFKLKGCCVAGIPIARGVARFLGMDVIEVEGANGMPDTNLDGKFEAVKNALKKYDFVFLHINGADILSHDAKPLEKKNFIEKVDRGVGKLKDSKDTIFIITCDHRTASDPKFKKYRHTPDPVPILISGNGIKPNRVERFDENSCRYGLKLEKNELVPYVIRATGN
ncbi:MAG: 2,3-bisphosphoglycerate-independent phosphoglycerate mutase [Candidatus Aenigmatarchaeota archaeon]|nr:MAG: 2,3-bisphosphoglycerate-independent phosphoglycerate mutase [Candidatus Aenigmarchaeota archaeon]